MTTRWELVERVRHPGRPTSVDYIERLATDFVELHGDRLASDDTAVVAGPARIGGRAVMLVGLERGRTPEEAVHRRRGAVLPDGFRKAIRLARLAERLGLPIVTFVDTPGGYPGELAEERGQTLAIAESLATFIGLRVPVVACVIGEGSSGGALALSVADRLIALSGAIFPVISPEACSSILFRDGEHARESAEALRFGAPDLLALGIVDELVEEPEGGAHLDKGLCAARLGEAIVSALDALSEVPSAELVTARAARVRSYGTNSLAR